MNNQTSLQTICELLSSIGHLCVISDNQQQARIQQDGSGWGTGWARLVMINDAIVATLDTPKPSMPRSFFWNGTESGQGLWDQHEEPVEVWNSHTCQLIKQESSPMVVSKQKNSRQTVETCSALSLVSAMHLCTYNCRTDVVFDIETMDTIPGGWIPTIGISTLLSARINNTLLMWAPPTQLIEISLSDQRAAGASPQTVLWWMEQSNEARQSLINSQKHPLSAQTACLALQQYVQDLHQGSLRAEQQPGSNKANLQSWGYGANFDQPMINMLLHDQKVKIDIPYQAEMCLRTLLKDRNSPRPDECIPEQESLSNIKHDAAWDAILQRRALARAFWEGGRTGERAQQGN